MVAMNNSFQQIHDYTQNRDELQRRTRRGGTNGAGNGGATADWAGFYGNSGTEEPLIGWATAFLRQISLGWIRGRRT